MTDDTAPATPALDFDPVPTLASTLGIPPKSVAAVIAMLDEGNTVPFIARYRKERTGGLDEVQIRAIEERRDYLVELETRRAAILASVGEQGKLTPELEGKLRAANNKSELEDLYAPYRPRRKTRASVAREKGLEPLALRILAQPGEGDPRVEAETLVTAGLENVDDALAGARDIAAEMIADTAEVRAFVRREYAEHGELVSEVVPGKDAEPTKFEQYYAFKESVKTLPSHRFLAIRRGEAEGVLRAQVTVETAKVVAGIERLVKHEPTSPWADQLRLATGDALKRLLAPSVENDVRAELKQRSDTSAVDTFAVNLRHLLLAAPLGTASVIGVDPGLRTGCKCAAIDATGRFLGTVTIYITQGDAQLAKAKEDFLAFVKQFTPRAIAVGNGTGGREAEAFVKKALGEAGLRETAEAPFVVQVNEAGASVYSASDLAREEFPELDLTIRGAISIARRLQDPLAELVKIEPKSIGVGQYQHDVHQAMLSKKLGDVIESCVNHVGVELNTASAQLLGYVAGIGKSLAKKLVIHRDTHGRFTSRAGLMEVSGLGPKAFEQAAGFLRIADAEHPLDRSAVHPERYPLVQQIAADLGVEVPQLLGNAELVAKIDLAKYVTDDIGEPTLRDIAAELAKPGRDPRAEFEPPKFRDDVTSMDDLKVGMVLEGVVTNVTAFGAFVDIGVHNDGLVHVSQLAEQFVKDPTEVVKVGQKLTVRVLEVDLQRKRIGLSARRSGGGGGGGGGPRNQQPRGDGQQQQPRSRGGRGRGGGGGGGQPRNDQPQPQAQMQGQGQPGERGPRRDRGPRNDVPPQMQSEQGQAQPQQGADRERRQWRGEPSPQGDQPQGGDAPTSEHVPNAAGEGGQPAPQQRGPRGPRGGGGGPRPGGGGGGGGPRRDDRGPMQGGPSNDRGGFGGGSRPDDRGPMQGGPGGPRGGFGGGGGGPRGGGGGPRGGFGGGGGGGPRRDDRGGGGGGGPRRDDRGPMQGSPPPRRDERRPDDAGPDWGVSGFKNNPFAKLVADKPKRS